jgi:hypothetical protein
MRFVVSALVLALAASAAHAQSNEEKRDAKLKLPFLTKAAWITDFTKAKEEARKTGNPIFAYFTRSYAK